MSNPTERRRQGTGWIIGPTGPGDQAGPDGPDPAAELAELVAELARFDADLAAVAVRPPYRHTVSAGLPPELAAAERDRASQVRARREALAARIIALADAAGLPRPDVVAGGIPSAAAIVAALVSL